MRRTFRAVLFYMSLSMFCASRAPAQITLYYDRGSFLAALGSVPSRTDDYESYAAGDIALGDRRGSFVYVFDQGVTQPAVVPGGNGGQALGGAPFDVFVGGDLVTLVFSPPSAPSGSALRAFGADFLYAPAFDTVPADTYRLGIADGPAAGAFAGNLDNLDTGGGTFFLGVIADPGAEFAGVNLFSEQLDPSFVVPAYQVDDLIYAAVPEPTALSLCSLGCLLLLARLRRRAVKGRRRRAQ